MVHGILLGKVVLLDGIFGEVERVTHKVVDTFTLKVLYLDNITQLQVVDRLMVG
jgi:hypothetical protein